MNLLTKTMRRTLAVVGSLAIIASSGATAAAQPSTSNRVFYVSQRGNDHNSGESPVNAFRHIQRCAEIMQPGDTCLVESGTYPETVQPEQSGTASEPITYAAAPGANVTITGTQPVNGWSQVTQGDVHALAKTNPFLADSGFATGAAAGHIYASHVTLNSSLPGAQIFYRNKPLVEAQWPYPGSDPMTPQVELAGTGTTNTSIADPNLNQPAGYWDGAQVYTEYWFISQTGTVSSSQPGSISLANLPDTGSCVGLLPNNTRYYLFGQLKMLSHPNEWYYDKGTQTLYVWTPDGSPPTSGAVEVQQRQYGLDLDNVSHTRVVGLNLFADSLSTGDSSIDDVVDHLQANYVSAYQTIAPAPNPVYQDACSILTAGETNSGLIIRGTDNVVEDSTIAHSSGDGIALLGNHNTVTNDTIHDVDAMGTYAAGVDLVGNDQSVTHNTIYRTGRSGITTDWHVNGYQSHGNVLAYNDIYDFDRLNLDSGAIYVCCTLDMSGTRIDHNWLHSPTPLPGVDPWAEAGFYTDTSSSNATVFDNVGWSDYVNNSGPTTPESQWDLTPVALFINGGGGNQLYNNDGPVQGAYNPSTPNTVENNIGTVYQPTGDGNEVSISHNLPSTVDPEYVDPSRDDYQLKADSPARNAGVVVPGVTVGGTDPQPSLGAYQYGAPEWIPGAH